MSTVSEQSKTLCLSTVEELHLAPGLGWAKPVTVRNLLFKADQNGLRKSGAIVKLGRRVLIDIDRFSAWLEQHRSM